MPGEISWIAVRCMGKDDLTNCRRSSGREWKIVPGRAWEIWGRNAGGEMMQRRKRLRLGWREPDSATVAGMRLKNDIHFIAGSCWNGVYLGCVWEAFCYSVPVNFVLLHPMLINNLEYVWRWAVQNVQLAVFTHEVQLPFVNPCLILRYRPIIELLELHEIIVETCSRCLCWYCLVILVTLIIEIELSSIMKDFIQLLWMKTATLTSHWILQIALLSERIYTPRYIISYKYIQYPTPDRKPWRRLSHHNLL